MQRMAASRSSALFLSLVRSGLKIESESGDGARVAYAVFAVTGPGGKAAAQVIFRAGAKFSSRKRRVKFESRCEGLPALPDSWHSFTRSVFAPLVSLTRCMNMSAPVFLNTESASATVPFKNTLNDPEAPKERLTRRSSSLVTVQK